MLTRARRAHVLPPRPSQALNSPSLQMMALGMLGTAFSGGIELKCNYGGAVDDQVVMVLGNREKCEGLAKVCHI